MENSFTTFQLPEPGGAAKPDPVPNPNYVGLDLYGRQYNYQTPLVQTENLTVEDQFTSHDAVQIGYVGTQGRHLDNLGYNNSNTQILPTGANPQSLFRTPSSRRNTTYETTNATSSYNSPQITYQHQTSFGLSLLSNYT